MNLRRWFAGFTAFLVLAAAAATIRVSAGEGPPAAGAANHGAFASCAKECSDCQRICDACAAHCAAMMSEGHNAHRETLASCQDCADLCAAASRIVARSGPYASEVCRACADVCKQCAERCEQFSKDETMRDCAQECRKCQQACEQMLKNGQERTSKRTTERK